MVKDRVLNPFKTMPLGINPLSILYKLFIVTKYVRLEEYFFKQMEVCHQAIN